jgi:tetratricopeptide (TPR) repeat protein
MKYLSEFYTYKAKAPGQKRIVADPNTSLEHQLQVHVLNGNQAFFQGNYSLALSEYLTAWGLLPKIVYPSFPVVVATMDDTLLLGIDMLGSLLEASVQIHRFRDLINPQDLIVPPIDPPPYLVQISERYGSNSDQAQQYYQLGVAYTQMGEIERALDYIHRAVEFNVTDLSGIMRLA